MDAFWLDLRVALRQCRRRPGFVLTVVSTLALTIGATTAVFAVVNAVLLRALPFKAPERLVYITSVRPDSPGAPFTLPEYMDYRQQVRTLTGLAAYLNAARFSAVPSNTGIGLELKAVAAVVVGGTAIRGGRGTLVGTLVGTALLGTIAPALTFVGINPFWEKAIQGGIILGALASDRLLGRLERHALAIAR